jgi:hypothetical protein
VFWQEAEVTENFPIRRFVSTPTARWELGLRPMLYGTRISMSLNGDGGIELDYCCGQHEDDWFLYMGMVAGLCLYLPESIEPHQLRRLFPQQTIRPLRQDRKCVDALFALAEVLKRYDPH